MEEEKEPIEANGLIQVEPPVLPIDPYDVTFVSYNNETYEYIRRYTTLLDPSNVENGIIENLLINDTTVSVDPTTGALVVKGGTGIIGNLNVGGGTTIAGVTTITNTTQSTNPTNGALVVNGGVGIVQNLNVGGITSITNTTQSVSKDTGALIVDGGVGIEKDLYVGGNFISGSNLSVGSTTESYDTTTGALVISGGVGIAKNLNIGGSFTSIGIATINNSTSSISTTTGAFQVKGGVGVGENLNVGGNVYVSGISTFIGNVDFRGGTNGTITLGDTSGDNVVFNADVNSSIIPDIDNLYNLGSTIQRWKDGYFGGTVFSTSVNVTGVSTFSGGLGISTGTFGDGSVTLPSITFTNDLDTGFWRPGTNSISLSTGGVERIRVDASGNINLGTTGWPGLNPARMTVFGAGDSNYNCITLTGSSTSTNVGKGGVISGSRYTTSNEPFMGFGSWDDGSSRYLYVGGGGWNLPDAYVTNFYAAPLSVQTAYNELNDQGDLKAYIRSFGTILESSYPANDFGFGQSLTLRGDIYSGPGYTARWTNLSLELRSGATANFLSSWSDTTWRGGNAYDIYIGSSWGGNNGTSSNGASPSDIYFQTISNGVDWSGDMTAFRINGTTREFTAYGPAYTARPAYFCRAWANFDGDTLGTFILVGTGSFSIPAFSGTCTVTLNGHGLEDNQYIYFDDQGTSVGDSYEFINLIDGNTFTIAVGGSAVFRSGTALIYSFLSPINASGNISSIEYISTGKYQINFTQAMPDTNYATVGGGRRFADVGNAEASPVISFSNYGTTSVRMGSQDNDTNTYQDSSRLTFAIFR